MRNDNSACDFRRFIRLAALVGICAIIHNVLPTRLNAALRKFRRPDKPRWKKLPRKAARVYPMSHGERNHGQRHSRLAIEQAR